MVHVERGVHQHQHHDHLRFFIETPHHRGEPAYSCIDTGAVEAPTSPLIKHRPPVDGVGVAVTVAPSITLVDSLQFRMYRIYRNVLQESVLFEFVVLTTDIYFRLTPSRFPN